MWSCRTLIHHPAFFAWTGGGGRRMRSGVLNELVLSGPEGAEGRGTVRDQEAWGSERPGQRQAHVGGSAAGGGERMHRVHKC